MNSIELNKLTKEQQEEVRKLVERIQMTFKGKELVEKGINKYVYEDATANLFRNLDCCEKKGKLVKWYKFKTLRIYEEFCKLFDMSAEDMPMEEARKIIEKLVKEINTGI